MKKVFKTHTIFIFSTYLLFRLTQRTQAATSVLSRWSQKTSVFRSNLRSTCVMNTVTVYQNVCAYITQTWRKTQKWWFLWWRSTLQETSFPATIRWMVCSSTPFRDVTSPPVYLQ